jgi:diguanylate cyclase (GGDEF)-like protein
MKLGALWKRATPPYAFTHLRTRLVVLYAALFTLSLIGIAVVAQVMIWGHARESVRAELVASGTVYDRIWALRAKSLAGSADVLARDFGFRTAVASGDGPTIESAIDNLRERADVSNAFVVDMAGNVLGNGPSDLRAAVAKIPSDLPGNRRDAVIQTGGGVYRLIVSPILAPTEIGWVVFALPLDAHEMRALEHLSAIPLTATILHRDANGHWVSTDGSIAPNPDLDRLVEKSEGTDKSVPAMLRLPSGAAFALARPLEGRGDRPEAALLLSYAQNKALASYWTLEPGIALAGLLGLALVLFGSRRLANTIARPIAALDVAARALEEGGRARVAVVGSDEIARLAESFNLMSASIAERERRITHLAFHDTLTDLPNRPFLRQQLEAALMRTHKRGEKVAVLCLDLDTFKGINDTLGHLVGDALLGRVGALLVDLASDGLVSRLGGDEFGIVLSDSDDDDRPRALAQEILDRMRQPFRIDGNHVTAGLSIGIAISPADGTDADTLLKNADLALDRAKQDGRGIYHFFEPALDAAARKRRQLELDLREALQTGEFRLNFQPIFDLKNNRIGGLEALLRWEQPIRGDILPSDFIPVAEDLGLISGIGEWVLHEACRQAVGWPDHVRVAVNVSPLQFRSPGFANIIFQALSRSGLAPGRLEVEITESVFLEDGASVVTLLHQLRSMGVRIALDDFGTGYSSLSYLRSFPFDKIKIDKSFVNGVALDASSAAIVHAIVDLATTLRMETTAEGVEHSDQLACLRDQGCTSIQGFIFSAAVEGDQVLALLGKQMTAAA